MLGKRKYHSLGETIKQATLGNSKLPNFVSYNVLSKENESIDIAKICELNKHLGIKQEKVGGLV